MIVDGKKIRIVKRYYYEITANGETIIPNIISKPEAKHYMRQIKRDGIIRLEENEDELSD